MRFEEMKKRVTGDIRRLNRRLLKVSQALDREARAHKVAETPPGRIVTSLFRKAVNTFRGIEVLKTENLTEEAWVLLRVLLEVHVNLLYFLRGDGKEMTLRYLDASVLDKLKHLREVKFYEGTPLAGQFAHRDKWEQAESEIRARYSAGDLAAIRRHGFTGLPFDQRSKAVGLQTMYEYCYRIASRSVHTFDPAETSVFEVVYREKPEERKALLASRRASLESIQNMLLGRLAYLMSVFVKSPLTAEIILIGVGYEKFRDQTPSLDVPLAEKEASGETGGKEDSESFYVWRE